MESVIFKLGGRKIALATSQSARRLPNQQGPAASWNHGPGLPRKAGCEEICTKGIGYCTPPAISESRSRSQPGSTYFSKTCNLEGMALLVLRKLSSRAQPRTRLRGEHKSLKYPESAQSHTVRYFLIRN